MAPRKPMFDNSTQIKATLSAQAIALLESAVGAGLYRPEGEGRTARSSRSLVIQGLIMRYLPEEISAADPLAMSWEDYQEALLSSVGSAPTNDAQESIRIFGKRSYQTELDNCREIFSAYDSFADIPLEERQLLAGYGASTGWLGNMNAAYHFKQATEHSAADIARHLDRIPLRGTVSEKLEREVLAGLLEVTGLGIPAASRLLAVRRPDLYLSLNGANIKNAEAYLGQIRYESKANRLEDYLSILARIRKTAWYCSARPSVSRAKPRERFLWRCRVALLDVLFYASASQEA